MLNPINQLNKLFDSRVRLGIMSALMVNESVNFNELKELLEKKGIETSSVLEYRTNNLKNLTDYIKTELAYW
jgi:hypothetical protein